MTNRLAAESSPYLLQHAENPVEWYPWGPEAFGRARSEDRPILLSIGYSACHWCHVMERESFEDPTTAALMNELFVNVKVDREERPDVDQVYMKAVQAMTGRGGWPMTVFLTPDLVPFFGGTYYPPEPRPGIPSFSEVLRAAADAFIHRRDQVEAGGARLVDALRRATPGSTEPASEDVLETVRDALARRFDEAHGGFGRAPKFPQPTTIEFLLRYHERTSETGSLHMAVHTLRRMADGGIRDHLAGGFHRYSVDERWLVPHFEKMLYDNALLARAYLEAYRLTGSDDLADVATETLDYLLTDMRGPEGGFYAARDADSEGEEGTFYVWTPEEVEAHLSDAEARLFARTYDVSPGGNFEGRSILHLPHGFEPTAVSEGISTTELRRILEGCRARLLEARDRREPPFRDEKVIVAWNGMTIRALAEAGALLGRSDYLAAARKAADFVLRALRDDEGGLLHSWIDGRSEIPAFLDDHAAFGNALLSLHGATLEHRWLEAARAMADEILARFFSEESGAVYDAPDDGEELFLRPRDPLDGATPSGTALAAELLARAGQLFEHEPYREAASRIIDHESETLGHYGPALGRLLGVLDRRAAPPTEIVIAGRSDDPATAELVRAAHARIGRAGVITGRLEGDVTAVDLPLLRGREPSDGPSTAWVCSAYTCRLPVTDAAGIVRELAALHAPGTSDPTA